MAERVVDDVKALVSVIRHRFRCEDVQLDVMRVAGRRVRMSHVNRDSNRVSVQTKILRVLNSLWVQYLFHLSILPGRHVSFQW